MLTPFAASWVLRVGYTKQILLPKGDSGLERRGEDRIHKSQRFTGSLSKENCMSQSTGHHYFYWSPIQIFAVF
jgi:hypothetical protein